LDAVLAAVSLDMLGYRYWIKKEVDWYRIFCWFFRLGKRLFSRNLDIL